MSAPTPWLDEARRLAGVAEIPGAKSNGVIMAWAAKLGGWIASFYKNDDTPWCGLFAAHCVAVGSPRSALPSNPLSALAWAKFGAPCPPGLGAVLVFNRPGGGGHVGFYLGETADAFLVLGGNTANKVGSAWVARSRLVAVRWPGAAEYRQPLRVAMARSGKLSVNEA